MIFYCVDKVRSNLRRPQLVSLIISLALFGGCATLNDGAGQAQNTVDARMKEADAELAKGQREKAVAILTQASKENPTTVEPLLKIANISFEAGNYPSTIVNANEVLARDPENQQAKSLLVVSGLRVAANAVAGLRSPGTVNTNARVEAENLTNSLRTMLGEKVLVPAPVADIKQSVPSARAKAKAHTKTASKPAVNTPSAAPASSKATAGATDPFKSLK